MRIMNAIDISGDEALRGTPAKKRSLPARIVRTTFKHPRIVGAVLLIIVVAVGAYVYTHRLTPEQKAAAQVAAAVTALEKHMLVPAGTPVLATVQDAQALKSQQAFFANAQNGDQILLFPESRQAVLYSPSRGVIVNVGPIEYPNTAPPTNNTSPAVATAPTTLTSFPVTVEVRNGTGKSGRGAGVAEALKKDPAYSVLATTDAKSKNYTSTIVVDVAKKAGEHDAINALAKNVGGSVVSDLPKGEAASSADVVIILGSGLTP